MALRFTQKDKFLPGHMTRICEICGQEGLHEYMFSLGASWLVTGDYMVASFNCQTEPTAQHWGCTPEHAMQALFECLNHDEHMSVNLIKGKHEQARSQGLPSVAPEHLHLLDKYGNNFPFDVVDSIRKSMI